jgi:hypothetical protein
MGFNLPARWSEVEVEDASLRGPCGLRVLGMSNILAVFDDFSHRHDIESSLIYKTSVVHYQPSPNSSYLKTTHS